VLLVGNKSDLPARGPGLERVEAAGALHVSAMTGDGLEALEHHLHEALAGGHDSVSEHAILAGARQREALAEAERALGRALASDGQSPEFLSIDLREAARALGSITGDDVGEDVLDRIFASFCIGK
jgi:tRNA modification GTPase